MTIMNGVEGFRGNPVTYEDLTKWLNTHKFDPKYIEAPKDESHKTDEYWEKNVNGAKVLADLFNKFSETRVEYDKVTHGIILTKWIVSKRPENFVEIKDLLMDIYDIQNKREA